MYSYTWAMKTTAIFIIFFGIYSFELNGQITHSDQELKLLEGFKYPPKEAKARTWWHWISGHISKPGITSDLEAMKAVGIQEAQLFNVALELPQGEIEYLSNEWLDLIHFSAREAERLGLELAFHNSAGWSSSGGPWVTPEYGMQKVVWSEVTVEGGKHIEIPMPQPETKLGYYKDISVLAFPKPKKAARIKDLDFKNLSGRIRNHLWPDTAEISSEAMINKNQIIDISIHLKEDGTLEWMAPKGEWIILRLGHTPIGKMNHPAPIGGHGLEVDKMSKKAVDVFWAGGIQPILDKLGNLVGSTVNNCIIDSYEVGAQNWTSGFDVSFKTLRGYDLFHYLPTLAGYYVESAEVTERFLWDFRRTIGDLIAENYYGHFSELCHKNNLKFSVEPYWGPFDNMQVGATGDIVMCEFWSGGYPFFDSPKFVSSIAHLNGNAIVGAEAFTGIGGWDEHPARLKSIGDQAWAEGITRFIFHTYVHQPWDIPPGLALSYHGTDFNRLNTWWKQSKSYMDYIARSQFLLQQGKSVADVLVFTGESSPNTGFLLPEIKTMGFDYDLIGANKLSEVFMNDGYLCTPVGGKYKVLVLPGSNWITPEVLDKIKDLVNEGATVIGNKPYKSPGLTNYPNCDEEVIILANALWDNGKIKPMSISDFLKNDNSPDFKIEKGPQDAISFIHRKSEEADIYFIANSKKESRNLTCRFRVSGKQPELWYAETGEIEYPAVWKDNGDGTTSLPLHLGMEEAVFIVFKEPAANKTHLVAVETQLEYPRSEPLSKLEIIKAEYGTFLQEGLADITEIVRSKVSGHRLNILANRMLCDCDPAMGYIKEFRMQYQIGNETHEIFVEEREPVSIDAGDQELKILKAVFGKFKPETKGVPEYYPLYDITEDIRQKVNSGKFDIVVSDVLIENKTIQGDKPSLRVIYKTDGEERTVMVPEGHVLDLSRDIPESQLVLESGVPEWLTPYPGRLVYTTPSGNSRTVRLESVPQPIELTGAWDVDFKTEEGVSIRTTLEGLRSWTEFTEANIKYFSGTARYKKVFILPDKIFQSNEELELDLGSVAINAGVTLNGKYIGALWKAPFRIKISDFVKKGMNTLEVSVTNLWPNRLIGDEQFTLDYERKGDKIKQLPSWLLNHTERPSERTTFASWKHWGKDDELKTSGLLGPVKITRYNRVKLKSDD